MLNVLPIPVPCTHIHVHTPAPINSQVKRRQQSQLTIELVGEKIMCKVIKYFKNRKNNTDIEITREKDLEARSQRFK